MARVLDEDELIEHWTLVGDELNLLTGPSTPNSYGQGQSSAETSIGFGT